MVIINMNNFASSARVSVAHVNQLMYALHVKQITIWMISSAIKHAKIL